MVEPRISVVIATYNRADQLPHSVQSVLEQTFQDFEVILVDDCSRDETPAVIEHLLSLDKRIHSLCTQQNSGPGAARNLGIALAKGEFIAILDDDDRAGRDRLEIQHDLLSNHPEIDVVFSPVQWVDDYQEEIGIFPGRLSDGRFPSDPRDVFRLLYLESNKIPNTTLFFRRILFKGGKLIDEQLRTFAYPSTPRVGEDWFLMMQLSATGVHMLGCPKPLVVQQRGHAHNSLMKNTRYAYSSQRQVLSMIRSWLAAENITGFDPLHRHAFSNQLIREARGWSGLMGIGLCFHALLYAPGNPAVYRTLADLIRRAFHKLQFLHR